ncbi:MAG: hypothetical protein K6C35_06330 [Eubacterium sp.]|nr:hypothetical protein [Eubacterium sp.]
MKKGKVFKIFAVCLVMTVMLASLCSCGSKKSKVTDKWDFTDLIHNGETLNAMDPNVDPSFKSTDGKNFEFSINGNKRTGVLEKNDDGSYAMIFNGKTKSMELTIDGDKMTIVQKDISLEMHFKKK